MRARELYEKLKNDFIKDGIKDIHEKPFSHVSFQDKNNLDIIYQKLITYYLMLYCEDNPPDGKLVPTPMEEVIPDMDEFQTRWEELQDNYWKCLPMDEVIPDIEEVLTRWEVMHDNFWKDKIGQY